MGSFRPNGGYCFISNVLEMKMSLPISITPNIQLDRANEEQIEFIRGVLDRCASGMHNSKDWYEKDWVSTPNAVTDLSHQQWRYHVINYSGNNGCVIDFFRIAALIRPYLTSFVSGLSSEPFGIGKKMGWILESGLPTFYTNPIPPPAAEFTAANLAEIQKILRLFDVLDPQIHSGILRAVDLNYGIKSIGSIHQNLTVLSLFAIIEMLLTHNPNDKEIGDSLTHQIKTKIALLSQRLAEPFDYTIFGDRVLPHKIWGGLYDWRSCIAHGSTIDFSSNSLKGLKNERVAFDFLSSATKKILVHAITEPDLVDSLKPI